MPEDYLQTAFEIKASCDEISRRLLRWHWEQKPGAHTMAALTEHLERRRQESPDYYDRLPALENKMSWQQLDTTLCMRVLLDPEKDAARPLDLLGSTPRPAAARRACNAVRTARNQAAHASDKAAAIEAALCFNEAIESLEEGYLGTALGEKELAAYYREAEGYLARCKGEKSASARPEVTVYPTGAAREDTAAARSAAAKSGSTSGRSVAGACEAVPDRFTGGSRTAAGRPAGSGNRSASSKTAGTPRSGQTRGSGSKAASKAASSRKKSAATPRKSSGKRAAAKRAASRRRQSDAVSPLFVVLALLVLVAGLLLRARSMGYLPF